MSSDDSLETVSMSYQPLYDISIVYRDIIANTSHVQQIRISGFLILYICHPLVFSFIPISIFAKLLKIRSELKLCYCLASNGEHVNR